MSIYLVSRTEAIETKLSLLTWACRKSPFFLATTFRRLPHSCCPCGMLLVQGERCSGNTVQVPHA